MTETRIWVLADPRAGTAAQALGIAERLDMPFRTVPLGWGKLARLPLRWPMLARRYCNRLRLGCFVATGQQQRGGQQRRGAGAIQANSLHGNRPAQHQKRITADSSTLRPRPSNH